MLKKGVKQTRAEEVLTSIIANPPNIKKIEQSIKHCRDVAKRTSETECADEHLELALWLEDYVALLRERGEEVMLAPVKEIKKLVEKHDVGYFDDSRHCHFEMFADWYALVKKKKIGRITITDYDVDSCLILFNKDMKEYWNQTNDAEISKVLGDIDIKEG